MFVDKILLAPYYWTLKFRHFMFNHGWKKSQSAEVPTICVGNVTVGGTGKTPHTEMVLRTLLNSTEWGGKNIAVLSRGYKRKTKGFQQVVTDGTAKEYGDEPLQIKNKFPFATVAVDKSRVRGCDFLCNPDKVATSKKARKCKHKDFPKSDIIILDDAFQHRAIKPSATVVLIDYARPTFKDHLMPLGRLRDLPERVAESDIIIVSKCPKFFDGLQRSHWAFALGVDHYDAALCYGTRKDGRKQYIFFTTIGYDTAQAVFPEGDSRYLYAKRLILFTGIANDEPLLRNLVDKYKVVRHFTFPDHHKYSWSDIMTISGAAKAYPTSVIMTTEKDCQRVRDCKSVPDNLKNRLFYTPIKVEFFSKEEEEVFASTLLSLLK